MPNLVRATGVSPSWVLRVSIRSKTVRTLKGPDIGLTTTVVLFHGLAVIIGGSGLGIQENPRDFFFIRAIDLAFLDAEVLTWEVFLKYLMMRLRDNCVYVFKLCCIYTVVQNGDKSHVTDDVIHRCNK